jgi:hypothetical protein
MAVIATDYADQPLTVKPGDRLHRLVALLFDTHYDDLTDERIVEIERGIESWRWCNAAGQRVS